MQKLIYYSQAWSLVWEEAPIFKEEILAWANGPVVKELYEIHRGMFYVSKIAKGNPSHLSSNQKDTINHVLEAYGDKSAQWLSDLTHLELPWKMARKDLQPGERGSAVITLSSMHEFYSSLDLDGTPISH